MIKKSIFILSFCITLLSFKSVAQDLMDMFKDSTPTTNYTFATFKTTRIVSSQSIENPAKGVLLFMISHHFGQLNDGAYGLYGLDKSTIRLGLEYGITNKLAIGIGRSTYQKNIDGFLKYKILRQSKGKRNMPLSISYFGSIACNGLKWDNPDRENYFSSRLSYTHQLLLARKFGEHLSLQLSPTLIHSNLLQNLNNPDHQPYNDVYACGIGGRYKLTGSLCFNFEYFYVLPAYAANKTYNSLAVGFDLETGGHVFQLYLTNSLGMYEKAFISETTSSWVDGGIHLGFNISRVFTLGN
jgi:hypothetical protein